VLPLHHVFPFVSSLLTPLIIGCSTMQISKIEGSFLLTAIQVHKPTILVVVPSILELFYQRIRGKINQLDSKQQKFISWLEKINQTSLNLLKLNLGKFSLEKSKITLAENYVISFPVALRLMVNCIWRWPDWDF
ncbi:hypothetical protein WJ883_11310, partial [Coxiella burnetii]